MGIRLTYNYKIWLEYDRKPLLGIGRYNLLKNIKRTSSLKISAEKLGISYKTAYNYIRKIEKHLGNKIIESHKGGKDAGGYTKLAPAGEMLIKKYEEVAKKLH